MYLQEFILKILNASTTPSSFDFISSKLSLLNIKPNKTTIYRNLEKLEKSGVIKKVILSDQKQFWEINQKNTQHYHLVCNSCESIECKPFNFIFSFDLPGFTVQKKELNLFGICQNCI